MVSLSIATPTTEVNVSDSPMNVWTAEFNSVSPALSLDSTASHASFTFVITSFEAVMAVAALLLI